MRIRLDEHFDDSGASTEVSVDLERGVGVEKVRICTSSAAGILAFISVRTDILQKPSVHSVCFFAFAKAGIEIDSPSAAPTCGFITFDFQCLESCVGKFASCLYLMSGIYAYEV